MSHALLDKREPRIRRMFGNIAPVYDLLNHLLSLNVDRYWRRKTTKLVPPDTSGPILDVCTGTGDLAIAYAKVADPSVPIVGTDFCHEMLGPARAKARKRFGRRIDFLEADTQHLPFADDLFQITTVAFGLRNVTRSAAWRLCAFCRAGRSMGRQKSDPTIGTWPLAARS